MQRFRGTFQKMNKYGRGILAWGKTSPVLPIYSWERELGITNNPILTSLVERERNWRSRIFYTCVKDYCGNTSLHGLKYITAENTYFWEKIFWLVAFVVSLTGAILFVWPFFSKYSDTAFQTVVESTAEPIWDIPFPGVTICNVNKAFKDRVKEQANVSPWNKYHDDVVTEIVRILSRMGQVHTDAEHIINETIKKAYDEHEEDTDTLMRNVAQPKERMLLECWWVGESVDCSSIFEETRTDEGYCWGFNSEPMRSVQDGEVYKPVDGDFYDENHEGSDGLEVQHGSGGHGSYAGGTIPFSGKMMSKIMIDPRDEILFSSQARSGRMTAEKGEFVPRTVYGAGPNMGLTVLLNPDVSEYWAATNNFFGFKVLVHDPEDFPDIGTQGFIANAGKEIFVAVTASDTLSNEDIKDLKPEKRKCFFSHNEQPLNFYQTYSYPNCLLECKVASMNRTCKCVPYIYNQLRNVKICDYEQMMCINNHTRKFSSLKPKTGSNSHGMAGCTCPKACEERKYFPEVTTADFPVFPNDILVPHIEDLNKSTLCLLRVFFKELTFTQYRQSLVYDWDDLIAAFGGIVGLFIGFSFISGVELIFYFIARPVAKYVGHYYQKSQPYKGHI